MDATQSDTAKAVRAPRRVEDLSCFMRMGERGFEVKFEPKGMWTNGDINRAVPAMRRQILLDMADLKRAKAATKRDEATVETGKSVKEPDNG